MKYFRIILTALVATSYLVMNMALAETAIIVHPSNGSQISSDDIKRIYLAKDKSFPGGTSATALNQKDGSDTRAAFDRTIVGKSPSQMKSYWAKLVFTGKATPLKQVDSDDEILDFVASNPDAIGYIDASKITSKVKVIHKF